MRKSKKSLYAMFTFLMIIGILYLYFGRCGTITAFSEEEISSFDYLFFSECGDDGKTEAEIIIKCADPEKLHEFVRALSNLKYRSKETMTGAGGRSFDITIYNRQGKDRRTIEILSDREICIGGELYHLKKGQMNAAEIRSILDAIKEYDGKIESLEVISGLEEFVAQFTNKPVLYSFTQENTEAVLVFVARSLELNSDPRLVYEPDYQRYTAYISEMQEDIDRLFDIKGITGFMEREMYGYGDRVVFYEHRIPDGGNPVMENVYIKDGRYICEGYIDGAPRYVSGVDSDVVIRSFVAVVSMTEDGDYRIYEFECKP